MQLSKFRRSVAAVAAAAVAFGGLALALPASAAPIILEATADLTIHKFEYDAKDRGKSDGLLKDPTGPDLTGLEPMGDIKFQVQQVPGFDLSTNDDWQRVGSLTATQAQDLVDGSPDVVNEEETTKSDGTATFEGLPIGLYLVTERLTDDQIAAGITAIDSPFLVTLPLTHPTDLNTWIYDVHVYPKNRVTDAPVKTVSDDDGSTLKVGDDIEWTITAPIPVGTLSAYGIRDVLSGHLSHTDTAVSVTLGDIALDPDDYTVIDALPGDDPEGNTNTVIVDFTDDGLRTLEDIREANAAAQVKVVLTTKVESLPSNGVIANEAALFPNDSYDIFDTTDRGVPSNEVKSKFGNFTITKTNQDEEDPQLLSGAEFQVFASEEDALAEDRVNRAISINGKSTWTTGDDGVGLVTIEGLRASNWADGVLLTDSDLFQTYWLVETKSPEGYELLAEPVEFTVLAGATDTLSVGETTIINVPENGGFDLPLTGGAGTALFTIIGLTLVAGAGVVLARSRKTATK